MNFPKTNSTIKIEQNITNITIETLNNSMTVVTFMTLILHLTSWIQGIRHLILFDNLRTLYNYFQY